MKSFYFFLIYFIDKTNIELKDVEHNHGNNIDMSFNYNCQNNNNKSIRKDEKNNRKKDKKNIKWNDDKLNKRKNVDRKSKLDKIVAS